MSYTINIAVIASITTATIRYSLCVYYAYRLQQYTFAHIKNILIASIAIPKHSNHYITLNGYSFTMYNLVEKCSVFSFRYQVTIV